MTAQPTRRITPVILSGGAGARLWPLSRIGRPKQLIALTGAETMLQETVRRVADPSLFGPPILVGAAELADETEKQLAAIGAAPRLTILEPCARNTAAAIALAALCADRDELLLVLPSDHDVRDGGAFRTAVATAAAAAGDDWLVTFGIAPTRAETGYGYVRRGEGIGPGVYRAERFVEKPDAATAELFLAEGGYDWNGGIFLLRAGAFVEALARHAPAILDAAAASLDGAEREGARLHPRAEAFADAPSAAVDRAVLEKHERVAVVPVEMGWSDVGSWEALYEAAARDGAGNAIAGEVVALDSSGCLIRSDGPLVVAVGAHDMVVVATERAVLIVPRGESQRVREAVEALRARGEDRERGE